jgi:quinol monooxygenase YgiN
MPVARHTAVNPIPGQAYRVEAMFDALLMGYAAAPGYLYRFRYRPQEDSSEIGRITIWSNHEDDDHIADDEHVIALCADLSRIIQGDYTERVLVLERTGGTQPGS